MPLLEERLSPHQSALDSKVFNSKSNFLDTLENRLRALKFLLPVSFGEFRVWDGGGQQCSCTR